MHVLARGELLFTLCYEIPCKIGESSKGMKEQVGQNNCRNKIPFQLVLEGFSDLMHWSIKEQVGKNKIFRFLNFAKIMGKKSFFLTSAALP